MEVKICPSCKEKNNPTFTQCWKCGKSFLSEEVSSKESILENEPRKPKSKIILTLSFLSLICAVVATVLAALIQLPHLSKMPSNAFNVLLVIGGYITFFGYSKFTWIAATLLLIHIVKSKDKRYKKLFIALLAAIIFSFIFLIFRIVPNYIRARDAAALHNASQEEAQNSSPLTKDNDSKQSSLDATSNPNTDTATGRAMRFEELIDKAVALLPSDEREMLNGLLRRFNEGAASLSQQEISTMRKLQQKAVSLLPPAEQEQLAAIAGNVVQK